MRSLRELTAGWLRDQGNQERVSGCRLFEGRVLKLDGLVMTKDMKCLRCNGVKGLSVLLDPAKGDERMWFCMNGDCLKADSVPPLEHVAKKREGFWLPWLQANDLGDKKRDLSGDVQQELELIKAMVRFARKPEGVLVFSGKPGVGKTYASLKVAYEYLLWKGDCLFFSAHRLRDVWLQAQREGNLGQLMERLRGYGLLIVDDVGQPDATAGFMAMLFELLDYRMQWSDRGTLLTTN